MDRGPLGQARLEKLYFVRLKLLLTEQGRPSFGAAFSCAAPNRGGNLTFLNFVVQSVIHFLIGKNEYF